MKENIKLPLFYGASPEIFRRAEILRHNMTEAEGVLWNRLKYNQIKGYRFRRQHPINRFIVDFYCHKAKLVVELDGEIHNKVEVAERDEGREYMIRNFGIEVLRYKNYEVINDIDKVLNSKRERVTNLSSKPL